MARRLQPGRAIPALACLLLLMPAVGATSVPNEASTPTLPAAGAPMVAWAAQVSGQLKLDARQTEAFQRLLATFPTQPAGGPPLTPEQYRAMTQLQITTFVTDRVTLELAALHAQLEALRTFDALLSPEQRADFNAMTRPQPPMGQPADEPPSDGAQVRADSRLLSHTEAGWLVKPKGEELWRVYPAEAQRKKVDGRVMLRCTADADGFVAQCSVASETPANQGFGNAALEMTAYMRMTPATDHGLPVPSAVNIPVAFTPTPAAGLPIPADQSSIHR
jgi:TonB family protein